MDRVEEIVFELIIYAGNARSSSMEAVFYAKQGKMTESEKSLKEAGEQLSKAHQIQTSLIQQEAAGQTTPLSLLLIHAQDHLMNAMTVKDLAGEFIDLYKRLKVGVEE